MEILTIQDAIKHSMFKQHKLTINKRYRETHREELKQKQKDYYKENKERYQEYYKIEYQTNKVAHDSKMQYWTETHRSKSNQIKRSSYTRNRKAINVRRREIVLTYRLQLFEILGGARCVLCGYDRDFRALCFDHVRDDGKEDRKMRAYTHYSFYLFYVKNPDIARSNLQVLCCNCNNIKKYDYMGYNPIFE